MILYVLVKLATAVACTGLAATIVVRDPGFKANRLMGAVLACIGWWSMCEVLWTVSDSPELTLSIARLSALGWMPVSAFFFHAFAELRGNARSSIHRFTPWLYGLSFSTASLYAFTPFGLESMARLPHGWQLTFGWLVVPGLLIAVVPALLVLLAWRASVPRNGSGGERRTSTVVFVSIASAVFVAAMTDVILPVFKIYPPLMGSTAVAGACCVIAVHLQRYGFSLLSADAFAAEIIGALPDGIALVRRDGSVRYVNPTLADELGIDMLEARTKTITDLLPNLRERLENVGVDTETVLRRQDGMDLPVVVSPVAVTHERWGIVGFALIVRDRREVAALRDRLVRSTRLAAMGDLSAGIAREIMRPMADVRTSLMDLKLHWQVLAIDVEKAGLGSDPDGIVTEGNDLIAESLEGVERVTQLVRNVQGFSAEVASPHPVVDLNEIVEHALRVALSGVGAGVSLEPDFDPDFLPVACERSELEQVVVNLIVNAFQAVANSGRVQVKTTAREGRVMIRVSDDGCGIPQAVIDRVFDPFFTTKPVGEGTGLGLAICYHIVRNHGGTLSVSSIRGEGTTFTVDLPAA